MWGQSDTAPSSAHVSSARSTKHGGVGRFYIIFTPLESFASNGAGVYIIFTSIETPEGRSILVSASITLGAGSAQRNAFDLEESLLKLL